MCKLNMIVTIVEDKELMKKDEEFYLAMGIISDEFESKRQIIGQLMYLCEILTTSLIIEDESYFEFVGLFDYQVSFI